MSPVKSFTNSLDRQQAQEPHRGEQLYQRALSQQKKQKKLHENPHSQPKGAERQLKKLRRRVSHLCEEDPVIAEEAPLNLDILLN
jgi:hypothetical protein